MCARGALESHIALLQEALDGGLLRDPLAARRAARQSAAGIGMDKAGWTSDAQKIFAEEKIRLAAVGRAGGASFDLVLTHGSKGVPVSKG